MAAAAAATQSCNNRHYDLIVGEIDSSLVSPGLPWLPLGCMITLSHWHPVSRSPRLAAVHHTSQCLAHICLHFTGRGWNSSFPTTKLQKEDTNWRNMVLVEFFGRMHYSLNVPFCTPLALQPGLCVSHHPPVHPSASQVWAQHHHSALQLAAVKKAKPSFFSFSFFHDVVLMTGLMALTVICQPV